MPPHHACPPATHAPCQTHPHHAHPLPCMPPATRPPPRHAHPHHTYPLPQLFYSTVTLVSEYFGTYKSHISIFVGFSEAETRYKLSDARTVKNAADAALPRKHKRRKTKEQPVSSVTVVAAAVQETKETLSNEKKPQRITASKKPSKYEKPSKYCNLCSCTAVRRRNSLS